MSLSSKNTEPIIAVFAGGTSAEREVSLASGESCAKALHTHFGNVELHRIDSDAVPAAIDPRRHVVLSTLHGTFGEDGGMQRLLDSAGIQYAGCGAASSELTMDKTATKHAVAKRGVPIIPGLTFSASAPAHTNAAKPTADALVAKFGPHLVLKPNAEGSSVGLHIISNRSELDTALANAKTGGWIVERRIFGRELAVGVLNGRAMGIVEIRPKSGVYDYTSKYTAGKTDYLFPAPFDEATAARIRQNAETAFVACECRDFARVDFMYSNEAIDGEKLFLIEINTLPGMTATSLLPKSASCIGLDFPALLRDMLAPAIARFHAANHTNRQPVR